MTVLRPYFAAGWLRVPRAVEQVIHPISQRAGYYLERKRLLVCAIEHSYLQLEALKGSAINDVRGPYVTLRTGVGPRGGPKHSRCKSCPLAHGEFFLSASD